MNQKEFELLHEDLAYLKLPWEKIKSILDSDKHPLNERTDDPMLDFLRVIRQPKNFYFTCKYVLNVDIGPFQNLILQEMWNCPFPMFIGSRGMSKSFTLAMYAILRALLCQGCKVALTGAVFRQSKVIFEYVERIWTNAPVLKDMMSGAPRSGTSKGTDKWSFYLGESEINAYPIGMGDKIRGQRANYLIVDEFASLNPEVFETVISGFASVSSSPIDNMKMVARMNMRKKWGIWSAAQEQHMRDNYKGNQTIISGTAYYSFNHFYQYWKKQKAIIESKGDPEKLEEIFKGEIPDGFDYRDWKLFRIPLECIPEGVMDEKNIARAKAQQHSTIYNMEYGAAWSTDSDGFFKRSLIESCTTNKPISKSSGNIFFKASLQGSPLKSYVYGVDPASEADNFSIVVLEPDVDHRKIVYCWTTTDKIHKELVKSGKCAEHDFYRYTARKIRNLMKVFPCELIALDSQGGGKAVAEALHEPNNLEPGEQPIWLITPDHSLSDGKERDCDGNQGLHILEIINFSNAEWTADANHGMKKDFEMQELIFPFFDALEVGLASETDMRLGRIIDTLEHCVMEIEELKDELASIVLSQTSITGRERWDTPEYKVSGSKKGRLRKDRYSALLMANAAARRMTRSPAAAAYNYVGGFANQIAKTDYTRMYQGPTWFTEKVNGHSYGSAINRNKVEGY